MNSKVDANDCFFSEAPNFLINFHLMTGEEIRQEYETIDRAKKDPAAFGPLYEKYFDRIFNFIFAQTDDEDLTADLCSQTFLMALDHVHKYEFRGVPVSAWFYKIASNEVNKHFNKTKSRKFTVCMKCICELCLSVKMKSI